MIPFASTFLKPFMLMQPLSPHVPLVIYLFHVDIHSFKRSTIQKLYKIHLKFKKKTHLSDFSEEKWHAHLRGLIQFLRASGFLSILNVIYEFLTTSIIGSVRGIKLLRGRMKQEEREREREGLERFDRRLRHLHSNTSSILSIPYLLTLFFSPVSPLGFPSSSL